MAKWLNDLYKEYMQEELEEDFSYHVSYHPIGGIYFGSLKALNPDAPNKPLYFMTVRKIDSNLYEVMKVSDWHHFATSSDAIVNIGTMTVIIETDMNFYLTADEISKFVLIDKLDEEMVEKIKRFREGDETDLRKGYDPISKYINLGDDYKDVRDLFKEEEFNQIKEFHTRVFEILAEPEEIGDT